jgi:vancomycin resistance protein YoaR
VASSTTDPPTSATSVQPAEPAEAEPGLVRRVLPVLGAVIVLLAVAYGAVAVWAGTRAPRGATVAGVDVGGMDRAGTERTLERELGPRADRPLAVRLGQGSTTMVPSASGLAVDARATAAQLVGFSLAPGRLWSHLTGAGAQDPVTTTDAGRLRVALDQVAAGLDSKGTDGAIAFGPTGATLTPAVQGRTLDRDGAAAVIEARWLDGRPVTLPGRIHEPAVPAAELQRAFEEFARPATSGPLTVQVAGRSVVVPLARLAPTLSVRASGGHLVPQVDGAGLEAVVVSLDPAVETKARNATIAVRAGKVVLTPGRDGRRLDPATLAAAVLPALTSAGRTADVAPAAVQPQITTQSLKDLGIVEQVSTFTTRFPYNPPRTTNIRIAAGTLDGLLVRPGETFSLNGALGRRTPEKGYQQAPVINGGRLTHDYGGGVSQVSTTLFNAVFFAGLDSLSHKAHSFYISRYPEGREATVDFPTVDQTFRNDSGHGILIKTSVSESELTVSFYGTKVWDVEAVKSPRTNIRQPRTIHDTDGVCVAQSPNTGFDVTVTRVFKRNGVQVKTEKFFTRYIPEDKVVCGPPAKQTATED